MKHRLPAITFLIPLILALSLAACEAPKGSADYRVNHPVTASEEMMVLPIIGGATDLLAVGERTAFERFIREYHLRGQGAVAIQVRRQGIAEDVRLVREDQARQLLIGAGVSAGAITLLPVEADKGAVVVISFMANKVEVPECSDWSVGFSENWTSRVHSNFGCATQRNIGLTIADPGDLNSPATMSNFDGNKATSIIDTYRTGGAATGTATTTSTSE